MSFGFSVGDILAVLELANKVRKRFVDAPEQLKAVRDEYVKISLFAFFYKTQTPVYHVYRVAHFMTSFLKTHKLALE